MARLPHRRCARCPASRPRRSRTRRCRGLKDGKVDVVVGTHRLLSKDVHFNDLGLLVVDEEQRFGVAHKERIKQLAPSVDVLTLTATPIPRTLQMAVTRAARPVAHHDAAASIAARSAPIVTRCDDQVIREAVQRELARGGQVFYVYNRVEGLYEKAAAPAGARARRRASPSRTGR